MHAPCSDYARKQEARTRYTPYAHHTLDSHLRDDGGAVSIIFSTGRSDSSFFLEGFVFVDVSVDEKQRSEADVGQENNHVEPKKADPMHDLPGHDRTERVRQTEGEDLD